jgi:hypothetical protein
VVMLRLCDVAAKSIAALMLAACGDMSRL